MNPNDDTFEKREGGRRSHALSSEVYRLLADVRDGGFKDQVTCSANSIPDHIAAGAVRRGKGAFKQFLSDAKGLAGDARSQILRAVALGYIAAKAGQRLSLELRETSRMIMASSTRLIVSQVS
jgi:four helix bundle protein